MRTVKNQKESRPPIGGRCWYIYIWCLQNRSSTLLRDSREDIKEHRSQDTQLNRFTFCRVVISQLFADLEQNMIKLKRFSTERFKSCIQETLNILRCAYSSTDTKTDRNGQKERICYIFSRLVRFQSSPLGVES